MYVLATNTTAAQSSDVDPRPAAAGPWTWDEIVFGHAAMVRRLAYRLTGNAHDADDLVQDVFVRAFCKLAASSPDNIEAWLWRVTTNLFIDRIRRQGRHVQLPLPEGGTDSIVGGTSDPAQLLDCATLDGDVRTAIDSLAPGHRAAVVLRDLEGFTYEEIAAALGLKLGTVRSHIHRGRTQLRGLLAHRAPRRAKVVDPVGSEGRAA